MRLRSLRAFLHEYRVHFSAGVDSPGDIGHIPRTMRAYAMQGTPTTLLIDVRGYLPPLVFGAHEDLLLGAELQMLLMEAPAGRDGEEASEPSETPRTKSAKPGDAHDCDESRCRT